MAKKLSTEQRAGFYTAVIAAGAALLGAIIGVIGSIYSQNIAATSETQRIEREACANFISSTERIYLILTEIYISSLGPETVPKSEYKNRLQAISDEALPNMFGQDAVVQLTMNSAVHDSAKQLGDILLAEYSDVVVRISESGEIVPIGTLEAADHRQTFSTHFGDAGKTFLNECTSAIKAE